MDFWGTPVGFVALGVVAIMVWELMKAISHPVGRMALDKASSQIAHVSITFAKWSLRKVDRNLSDTRRYIEHPDALYREMLCELFKFGGWIVTSALCQVLRVMAVSGLMLSPHLLHKLNGVLNAVTGIFLLLAILTVQLCVLKLGRVIYFDEYKARTERAARNLRASIARVSKLVDTGQPAP